MNSVHQIVEELMYLDLRLNLADDASVDKKSVTAFLPILEAVYVTFLAEMTIPDKL